MSAVSAQGWHARATPHPSPDFTPTKDALVFAVLLHAPIDEDLTMALFQPDIVIDARGRVLQPQPQDFAALAALAQEANRLPDTGSFMNAWRVSHARSCQTIDRLFAKTSGGGDIRETSVQGWDPEKTQLQDAVGDNQALPPVLQELFGYIKEGRTGFVYGEEPNKELVAQVKALVYN